MNGIPLPELDLSGGGDLILLHLARPVARSVRDSAGSKTRSSRELRIRVPTFFCSLLGEPSPKEERVKVGTELGPRNEEQGRGLRASGRAGGLGVVLGPAQGAPGLALLEAMGQERREGQGVHLRLGVF